MGFARVAHAVGGALLAGALVVATAPAASADQVRDGEWPLTAYKAESQLWPISTGKGVVVAVIDSGVNGGQADLTGQVLEGTDLVHGGNGQRDYSSNGHGTGVATLIAGHGHGSGNADGIMGLAPGAKILPIGVDPDNAAAGDHIADAIHYAVDHGARIINMSVGSLAPQNAQDDAAIAYAESHNVILVAGAGNDGASSIDYPAATPGVVAVAAVDKSGHVWSQSNYGKGVVLAAPGVDIVRAAEGGSAQYRLANGTSDATAYVSAVAALVVAKYPNLTAGQVINRLVKTALIDSSAASGQVPDPHYGYGIARPYRALTENIPAGPAAGPLAQATDPSNPSGAPSAAGSSSSSSTASSSSSSSSTGLIIAAVAAVAVLVLVLLIVLLVRRGKKNNNGGGGGFGPGGAGGGGQQYPPAYPQYGQPQQQAYPPQAPAPGGYRPPTGNGEQSVYQQNQNNPYAGGQQQPPYGGQPR